LFVEHPVLGEMEIPRAEITDIQFDDDDVAALADDAPVAADDGFLGTGWLTDWQRRFELGLTGAAGKSDDLNVTAGFTADYEDEYKRWTHKTAYHRKESDGERTDNSFYSSLQRDWLNPDSPWFQFAGARFDWDEFKDWDYRLSGNGGVGYEFIDTDRLRVFGRAGLGGNQTFGDDREAFTPEASLGVDVKWQISERQTLAFVNTLHPNLEESGEYRNLTSVDWVYDIERDAGIGLKIGLTNEYDSLAEDDVDENDFKYMGSLIWDL
jgi:putative salt-induced outer membrane protein YdiY